MNEEEPIITLEKLTYGGEALGRLHDGRAVFVPFALPGEIVRLQIVEQQRSHARARILEILKPSPHRITPRCRHFGSCGGCHYQMLAYEDQLCFKQEILREQLVRIGRIEDPPISTLVPSPSVWNYRNHVQFHLADHGKLGYIGQDGHTVIPILECHLPEILLSETWPGLQFEEMPGLERVSLRVGAGGEMMLVLESQSIPELELEANLSVVHLLDGEAVVMAGDDHLLMEVNERAFKVSAGAFFQVNTGMASKMVTHLLNSLPVTPETVLMDIYCGVGLFSAFFAGKVGKLIGIEMSAVSVEDFSVNLDEFENVELYQAAAEDVLPQLDIAPAIMIVDPPRSGLDKRVLDAIKARKPEQVAYVSCDPSTLARDANRLISGGYQLMDVTAFDLFPQTYHIESISIFKRMPDRE